MSSYAIDYEFVLQASDRIAGRVATTPCVHCERLSKQLGCELYLKAENLQYIGAFKARGAANAVLALGDEAAAKGVVTHSSGNHAAALARSAKIRGVPAHIVMPHNSARTKIEAVESFGIEPVFCEPNAESRDAVAAELQAKTGATLIHPYNNPFVMAGQGTVGLEIVSQVPDVDAIVAPIGGGGLISGILTAVKAGTKSAPWVFGAEPAWADDAFRGLKSGKIEQPVRYDTVADGLRSPVGELTFPIIRDRVEGILLAEESQIWMAVRDITEKAKLVCEPSGAVALAALQSHLTSNASLHGKKIVVVISGGNIDMQQCALGNVSSV